jgi:AcrR family transcriptional regulator
VSNAAVRSPSLPARRERNAVETKKRLLDAAEEEFAVKGFDGARLGNIARVAGVQHALIHHYFADKEGLYRDVLARGLGAVTAEGWDILERLAPPRPRRSKKRMTPDDLRALVEAFVASIVDFYATHGNLLLILRHEAGRHGSVAREFVEANVKPQFDEICARLDEMRARGEVRSDLHSRHLVLSAIGMACYPFSEAPFVATVWPVDTHSPEFLADRKREIAETLLARALP